MPKVEVHELVKQEREMRESCEVTANSVPLVRRFLGMRSKWSTSRQVMCHLALVGASLQHCRVQQAVQLCFLSTCFSLVVLPVQASAVA